MLKTTYRCGGSAGLSYSLELKFLDSPASRLTLRLPFHKENRALTTGTKNSGGTLLIIHSRFKSLNEEGEPSASHKKMRHNADPMMYIRWFLFVIVSSLCASTFAATTPQRIVSVGLCTDQLLLMMVGRERIASVTYTAVSKSESYMAAEAGGIPLNRTGVEEVISFQPDLVVGSPFAAQDTVRLLKELGYRVEIADPPNSIEGVRALVRAFGVWTGSEAKATEIIDAMDQRLAAIARVYKDRPQRSIMVYSPNGYTIGGSTLENEIFHTAGFRNLSAEMGIQHFKTISLEQLVASQPDFIQIDNYIYNQNSLASSYINHPVLQAMLPDERRLYMPTIWRDCAGPMVVDAVEYLASHR